MYEIIDWVLLAVVTVAILAFVVLVHAGVLHSLSIETGRPPIVDEPLQFCYTFALGESARRRKLKRLLLEVKKLGLANLRLVIVHYDERDKIRAERRRFAIGFVEQVDENVANQSVAVNGESFTELRRTSKRQSTRGTRSAKVCDLAESGLRRKKTSVSDSIVSEVNADEAPVTASAAMRNSRLKLALVEWPPISNGVFCEFPFRSRISLSLADRLVPSRIAAYTTNRRLSAYPLLEVRAPQSGMFAQLLYVAPLSKQDAFFVEEAVIRKR